MLAYLVYTHVIAVQIEGHFAVRDAHIGVVVHCREIRRETVDEAERLDEVLELERSRQLVLCKFPSGQHFSNLLGPARSRFCAATAQLCTSHSHDCRSRPFKFVPVRSSRRKSGHTFAMALHAMNVPSDRRQSARVQVPSGHLMVIETHAFYGVRLLDVSLGGFQVAGPVPYPIDAERTFRFTSQDPGWMVELRARVVYSHQRATDDGQGHEYLSGFEFVNPANRAIARQISDVVGRATDILTFHLVGPPV